MEVTCDSCTITFEKPKLKSGEATMCPRCRSLVVVPAAPVPRAPEPPPEPVAASQRPQSPKPEPVPEPVEAPLVGEAVARDEQAEPIAAEAEPAHVALLRSCPWCHKRYDVELSKCPRCGYSAARAQMMRNEAQEAAASLRPTPTTPRHSWRWVVYAVTVVLWLSTRGRSGALQIVLGLLVLGALVWVAVKVHQGGGGGPGSPGHGRDRDRPPRL